MSRRPVGWRAGGDERPAVEQMNDLYRLALDARMFGAAGWLERHYPWDKGEGHCCPPKLVKGGQERISNMLADTFDGNGQLR